MSNILDELERKFAAGYVQRGSPASKQIHQRKPKIYKLKTAPASATPSTGQYWALWKKVLAIKPGLSRFALTARTLGRVVNVPHMNPQQLGKMIEVFQAIIRDSKK